MLPKPLETDRRRHQRPPTADCQSNPPSPHCTLLLLSISRAVLRESQQKKIVRKPKATQLSQSGGSIINLVAPSSLPVPLGHVCIRRWRALMRCYATIFFQTTTITDSTVPFHNPSTYKENIFKESRSDTPSELSPTTPQINTRRHARPPSCRRRGLACASLHPHFV